MRDDRERRNHAELGALQKGRGDQHPVDEVMHRIADHDEGAAAAVIVHLRVRIVHFAVLGVAMAPEQELLQHEEREDAAQDRGRGPMRIAAREGMRNHLEKRRAEQRADGEGHQHRHPGRAQQQ